MWCDVGVGWGGGAREGMHFYNKKMHIYFIIIFFSTWICKITQFIVAGSILFLPPYTRGESELESNPGPLTSQATTLTTRPWLLHNNDEA